MNRIRTADWSMDQRIGLRKGKNIEKAEFWLKKKENNQS